LDTTKALKAVIEAGGKMEDTLQTLVLRMKMLQGNLRMLENDPDMWTVKLDEKYQDMPRAQVIEEAKKRERARLRLVNQRIVALRKKLGKESIEETVVVGLEPARLNARVIT